MIYPVSKIVTAISLFCTCVPNKVVAYIFLEGNATDGRETERAAARAVARRQSDPARPPARARLPTTRTFRICSSFSPLRFEIAVAKEWIGSGADVERGN
jgi:hypothetical protein